MQHGSALPRRLPALAACAAGDYGRPVPAARFVTDASLEFLARRLRFLGYDIAVIRGARLEELFEAARRDQGIVLSLSRRHPRAFADVPLVTVPADPVVAVRLVSAVHEPAGSPFSRCAVCGEPLQTRHPMEARGEVPGRVLRTSRELRYCPSCGKWYWEGTHVARIRAWLEEALGRAVR
jgi:uncharacterized protein with PIN domain